jgi:hypothetical protein
MSLIGLLTGRRIIWSEKDIMIASKKGYLSDVALQISKGKPGYPANQTHYAVMYHGKSHGWKFEFWRHGRYSRNEDPDFIQTSLREELPTVQRLRKSGALAGIDYLEWNMPHKGARKEVSLIDKDNNIIGLEGNVIYGDMV